MEPTVIIYSTDSTRSAILQKIMRLGGLRVAVCRSRVEIQKLVGRDSGEAVIVFDAKKDVRHAYAALKEISYYMPDALKIVLSDHQNGTYLQSACLKRDLTATEPLDPEYILELVQSVFIERAKKKTRMPVSCRCLPWPCSGRGGFVSAASPAY